MKLAIADPPYLGRANRWYGDGRGSGAGLHVADRNPDARKYDDPAAHRNLIARLVTEFDGWAIAAAPDSLRVYLEAVPADTRVMVWHKRNAVPSGARLASSWEPVLVYLPAGRIAHGTGLAVRDVLDAPNEIGRGFVGAKPSAWTRWVLDALGYDADTDEVVDLFAGSGAVTAAADGMLAFPKPTDSRPAS